MDLKGKKINFLGDSITFGHGTSEESKCFVSLIAERDGAICRNYGISGTRIARQITPYDPSFDQDFCLRYSEMDDDADIIVVFGGTNDFGHGDAPLGRFEDRTPYTFYGALHTLYQGLMTKYPASQIVILTPLHRTNEFNPHGDGNMITKSVVLKEYVDIIREMAEYYSLPVLDLYAASGMQPVVAKHLELYMPDGLHPNDAGHEILYHKISTYLKAL